jgi:hypothetical protein
MVILFLALAQDPGMERLASRDEQEREAAVDALIEAGQREKISKAIEGQSGDLKKSLEAILHAIDTSSRSRERLARHLNVKSEKIRELYVATAARFFGDIRFFWVEDKALEWPRGFFVDGDKVTQLTRGVKELVPIVEGRTLNASKPEQSQRVLFLLQAVWFGRAYEGKKVTIISKDNSTTWDHSWGDFGVILTTDVKGRVTRAEFWIW